MPKKTCVDCGKPVAVGPRCRSCGIRRAKGGAAPKAPPKSDMPAESLLAKCPGCGEELEVDRGDGIRGDVCPECGEKFHYDGANPAARTDAWKAAEPPEAKKGAKPAGPHGDAEFCSVRLRIEQVRFLTVRLHSEAEDALDQAALASMAGIAHEAECRDRAAEAASLRGCEMAFAAALDDDEARGREG